MKRLIVTLCCCCVSVFASDNNEDGECSSWSPKGCEGWSFSLSIRPYVEGQDISPTPVARGERVRWRAIITNTGNSSHCDVAGFFFGFVTINFGFRRIAYWPLPNQNNYVYLYLPSSGKPNSTYFETKETVVPQVDRIDIDAVFEAIVLSCPENMHDLPFVTPNWVTHQADANRDYHVDIEDFDLVLHHMNSHIYHYATDINNDHVVDELDLAEVILAYGYIHPIFQE